MTTVFGAFVGLIAGFYGGAADSVLSRIIDIFFGLPLLVVGIAALSAISLPGIWGVVLVLCRARLGRWRREWCGPRRSRPRARTTRPPRALSGPATAGSWGATSCPTRSGPSIVLAVIGLGGFIAAEATFIFLGLGIRPPQFSWGTIISESQAVFLQAPWTLLFPAVFLSLTVLAFILLGDAVCEALDPKLRR